MKKYVIILVISLLSAGFITAQDTMYIHKPGNVVVKFPINQIDSITFYADVSSPPVVGDIYQGGVVAYIYQPGDIGYIPGQTHGIIAAQSDQSIGATWGCEGTNIAGTSPLIGAGLNNTESIIVVCTTLGIAAEISYTLVLNGYSDWYLPGKDELDQVYLNRMLIGGFSTGTYWTSTQATNTTAWMKSFATGSNSSNFKGTSYRVRAIRAF